MNVYLISLKLNELATINAPAVKMTVKRAISFGAQLRNRQNHLAVKIKRLISQFISVGNSRFHLYELIPHCGYCSYQI